MRATVIYLFGVLILTLMGMGIMEFNRADEQIRAYIMEIHK